MIKSKYEQYHTWKGQRTHQKAIQRKKAKKRKVKGYYIHINNIKSYHLARGEAFKPLKKTSLPFKRFPKMPALSKNIKFLASQSKLFSNKNKTESSNGELKIPTVFSLIDNFQQSMEFLKTLFNVLYNRKVDEVVLNYESCKRIDVDASLFMDLILGEFIQHYRKCESIGVLDFCPKSITPINFERDEIKEVLFSIGAYKNIKGISINFPDVEELPVLINNRNHPKVWEWSEIHQTKIVDYIKRCVRRMGKDLTIESETSLYKVLGEVMNNAEEHGTMPHRYAIGFFKETHNSRDHYGIFNFTIFNFGKSIYQTFSDQDSPNMEIKKQMKTLSDVYTEKGFWKRAEFEEETLWTLYALQEGITSKDDKKRGNGSIQFIENFFMLKGNMDKDEESKLAINLLLLHPIFFPEL